MDWLDNEIDKWWCSKFTSFKMKRVSGNKFVPDPAFMDETLSQTENGTIKIACVLDVDWQLDSNEIEWEPNVIRDLAKYFYDLGRTH